MASLLDLPIELLILILERVGGRELRRGKGSARLGVCRTWYSVALPIYLSGFGTSNIDLYGHNIGQIRGMLSYKGLRPLMHKNTRDVRVRLLGHGWDEATAQADEDCEYTTRNELPHDLEGNEYMTSQALKLWRNSQLKPCLDDLFGDLRQFEALENIVVEARSEPVDELVSIPHHDYLHASTISRLISNLPITRSLASFTLDTYGTELLRNGHVCAMIANVLPRIDNVRLRMARMCPGILNFNSIHAEDVRLRDMIIKAHPPRSRARGGFPTAKCLATNDTTDRLFDLLFAASQHFVARLDSITKDSRHDSSEFRLRISHVPASWSDVQIIDCRTIRQYRLKHEWEAYEDDGKPSWFELEDDAMLVDCGPYQNSH